MTRAEQKANKDRLLLKELIDKMFELAGHDLKFEDVEGRTDNWFQQYTMTKAQNEEWVKWMKEYFKTECKMFSKIAEREANMCSLMWGLKFSDFNE